MEVTSVINAMVKMPTEAWTQTFIQLTALRELHLRSPKASTPQHKSNAKTTHTAAWEEKPVESSSSGVNPPSPNPPSLSLARPWEKSHVTEDLGASQLSMGTSPLRTTTRRGRLTQTSSPEAFQGLGLGLGSHGLDAALSRSLMQSL